MQALRQFLSQSPGEVAEVQRRLVLRATLGRVNGYAFASHYFVAFDSRATNQLDGPAQS